MTKKWLSAILVAVAMILFVSLATPRADGILLTGYFTDDNGNTFEGDIDAIAAAGITRGCNPPTNNHYCPNDNVDRGQMAAFLRRALELPFVTLQLPVGSHAAMSCSKDGERCTLTVDLTANRVYLIQEGLYQVTPASSEEQAQFDSTSTSFTLTLDGSEVALDELDPSGVGNVTERRWQRNMTFPAGTHTLVGRWRWDGNLIQTNTLTLRVGG